MMQPTPLADLIADDALTALQAAIVARLRVLLPGVTVRSHPGKIDIAAMLARAIVPPPGIAVGWTRIRSIELVDGAVDLAVEWAAYIAVEHKVLGGRRVEREQIGFALGRQLLLILADPDETRWGLGHLLPPAESPPPQLTPLYTVEGEQEGTGYLAVTWTQTLVGQGAGLFEGPAPALAAALDDDGRASIRADFGPDATDVPEAVRSLWQEDAP
ncbi:hypothetical protein [Prosthecomicrobium hirschii]|uniref:hypothetical protein n=1 Tax=Prosthecodimorpha hirschii TaxID=665126 RepID=UPI002220F4CA|nr:hypothetical protein [Prosthecomicrobium hirschii]MCW1842298.1 hypothetical protein [Prosthecomicrobium hirschii]